MRDPAFLPANDLTTARYLEERLGPHSAYAHSQTLHSGEETSEGLSERPVSLLSRQDAELLGDDDVIVFHKTKPKNNRPLKLKRMNWMEHPLLDKRQSVRPPKVAPLPPLEAIDFEEPDFSTSNDAIQFDDPDALVDPDMRRVSPRITRKYAASGKIWGKRGI